VLGAVLSFIIDSRELLNLQDKINLTDAFTVHLITKQTALLIVTAWGWASCIANNTQKKCCVYPRDEGSRGTARSFLTSGRDGGEQSASRLGHLTSGEIPGTHVTARSAPQPVWSVFGNGRSLSCRTRTPDRPARSQSLYRLSHHR